LNAITVDQYMNDVEQNLNNDCDYLNGNKGIDKNVRSDDNNDFD
jgi:hypothetical protein